MTNIFQDENQHLFSETISSRIKDPEIIKLIELCNRKSYSANRSLTSEKVLYLFKSALKIKKHEYMHLSHPKRMIRCNEHLINLYLTAPHYNQLLEKLICSPFYSLDFVCHLLAELSPELNGALRHHEKVDIDFDQNVGSKMVQTALLYRFSSEQTSTQIDVPRTIIEMLDNTHLSLKIPTSEFKLPFSSIYLNFENSSMEHLGTIDPASGYQKLEGVYIFSKKPKYTLREDQKDINELCFLAVCKPKQGILDSVFISWILEFENEFESIKDTLINFSANFTNFKDTVVNNYEKAGTQNETKNILSHDELIYATCIRALKIIMLINIKKNDLLCKFEQKKSITLSEAINLSNSNVQRDGNARKALNQIIISSIVSSSKKGGNQFEKFSTKSKHWRRGHIRRQRFGPNLTEVAVIFIEPTLVNRNSVGPTPKTKEYRISE